MNDLDPTEAEKILRESKASWQEDGKGISGTPTRVDQTPSLPRTPSFQVQESKPLVTQTNAPRAPTGRKELDPFYDGTSSGTPDGTKVIDIYGMQDGHPVVFHVLCVGDPTPVPEV